MHETNIKHSELLLVEYACNHTKKFKKWIGGDGYAYGLHCGNSFIGIYLSTNSLSCIH